MPMKHLRRGVVGPLVQTVLLLRTGIPLLNRRTGIPRLDMRSGAERVSILSTVVQVRTHNGEASPAIPNLLARGIPEATEAATLLTCIDKRPSKHSSQAISPLTISQTYPVSQVLRSQAQLWGPPLAGCWAVLSGMRLVPGHQPSIQFADAHRPLAGTQVRATFAIDACNAVTAALEVVEQSVESWEHWLELLWAPRLEPS
eukprot:TRINITY_DN57026_c0_g1_i1.p2 TRINITY_DN57026_c0_g1~~TRINITY_DN57026_c0_g1_i1.p2  ORF type:complete len:201 (-),score=19.70 TRINITY_DN57026_c0_g1_i1:289-891(-)